MGRCIAAIVAFAVPWFATWVLWILVVLIAAGILSGPIGWVLLAAIVGTIISIALIYWAFKVCGG